MPFLSQSGEFLAVLNRFKAVVDDDLLQVLTPHTRSIPDFGRVLCLSIATLRQTVRVLVQTVHGLVAAKESPH
jgi:hypothetical protein